MAKASRGGSAAAQAAAIRATPTPIRRYTKQDIDAFKEAGKLPRITVGAGRFTSTRPVQVGDPFQTASKTAPTRPHAIRQGGEDLPIFHPIPQHYANPLSIVASSFGQWLSDFADALEADEFVLSDEYGGLCSRDEL